MLRLLETQRLQVEWRLRDGQPQVIQQQKPPERPWSALNSIQAGVFSSLADINGSMSHSQWSGLRDDLGQTSTQGHAVVALAGLVIVNTGMNPDRLESAVHGKRPFLCCDALCGFRPAVITIL
ncbi:MAG: hypothetical protein CL859_01970 [Cyanobium sp. ARS6]|nr:hypothetical protein [Cyanobium sp. ARS6]